VKIAQVAPLFERVPPRCYGGRERVVSYLTEELVRQGHDVTLFASGLDHRSSPGGPVPKGAPIGFRLRRPPRLPGLDARLSLRFPIRQVTTLHEGRRTFTVFDGSTSVHDHASVYPRPPYPEDGAIQLLSRSRDLKIVSVR
jgi:glycosyltransferase involved in cell wall biosynthesis